MRLTNNSAWDAGPSWAPNGTQITFESDRDGNLEVYVTTADGAGQTRLTSSGDADRYPGRTESRWIPVSP